MNEGLQSILGESVNLNPDSQESPSNTPSDTPQNTPSGDSGEPSSGESQQSGQQEAKSVPLAALHEERARRRELQQTLAQERAAREEMERRVEARLQAIAKAQQAPVPSLEENPAAHILHKVEEVGATAKTAAEQLAALQQQQAQQQQIQQIATTVNALEAEFQQAKPDYHDALRYMLDSRSREFQALGMSADQARYQAQQEMMQGALVNASRGMNPAEIAYRLAEARGYRPQTAAPTADDRMKMQAKGIAASKSLGNGPAAGGKIGAEALLSMSDDEFAEATKGNNWRKLMGG
ncbi:MAG: hypothetical protein ACK52I_37390 [Pseudomonadota bacterium]|jgi:hypothetical protein